MKLNRTFSYIIVALVYVISAAVGIIVYNALPFDFWLSLLIADVVATCVTFVFSLIFNNASVYDPYWSVQPLVIVFAYALSTKLSISMLLPIIVITIWGVRLTVNWAYTFHSFEYQDWRYVMLKQKTGVLYPVVNFLGIHMFPTLVVYLCVLPAVFVIKAAPEFNAWATAFTLLSLLATLLQGVADVQMHRFRKNRTGAFIRDGLWKYSRHPNYLGEILMWWGVGLYAVVLMPSAWYLLAGAVVNTVMFLVISIPMADKRQSKKEGWEEYKNETFALLPLKKPVRKSRRMALSKKEFL